MAKFALLQKREIRVPTLWGWLLLFVVSASVGVAALLGAHPFLAQNDMAPSARLLVVEGWMGESELDQAAEVFRRGRYDRLVTTGGPIERSPNFLGVRTYAEWASAYLNGRGLGGDVVTAVPAPASAQDRTFLSAVKVRDWGRKNGVALDSLDVISSGTHARRSRMLFQKAFGPSVRVGVFAATPVGYDAGRWWKSSAGVKSVLGEATALVWTVCCFVAPAEGGYEETWGPVQKTSMP